MPSTYLRPVLMVVAVVAFVGGAVAIQRATIDHLLRDDAVSTARAWTEYLANSIEDLDAIAAGRTPSAASMAFFEQAQKVGQVFRYKIFDAEGRLVLVSDELPVGDAEAAGLLEHNAVAAQAIAEQMPFIATKEGTPPARPPFFSEAYIPVVVGGQVTAVVETYIDQTAKRAAFGRAFAVAAIALGLLVAVAFGVPATAWYLRRREQERSIERIAYLASHDTLSGLANRAFLVDRLTLAMADMSTSSRPLAVHCVDIDRFKDINTALGLAAGDAVLKIVADRLRSLAASKDIVARLAGDEFAVVQFDPGDGVGADAFARLIAQQLSAPVWINEHEVAATVSVGVAIAPQHGKDPERLIKSAKLALDKSKSEGRGHIRFFTTDLDDELHARLSIERAIDDALANDGFDIHFQPLYSANGTRLVGFEALARLPVAGGEFIPPMAFIAAAERTGVIHRIGAWIMETACVTAADWPEPLTVAVNLSPAQFGKDSVYGVVAAALAKSGLRPGRLQLEITESLLLSDTETVMRELARLKELGVAIVMDDFGTGYSSLSYLWRFPFDKLKIDASFMQAVELPDTSAAKIIRTIVTLGRSLGMTVCVEGVETERQAAFVRSIDCDEVQGFHFGLPVPRGDLAAVILSGFRKEMTDGQVAHPTTQAAG